MVLTGKIGPELVARIHKLGGQAVGMSGEDGPTLMVRPRGTEGGHDLGFVGEVDQVNAEPVEAVLDQGRIPVIASIGLGVDGDAYNVNADTVAAELAVALRATEMVLFTDARGCAARTASWSACSMPPPPTGSSRAAPSAGA